MKQAEKLAFPAWDGATWRYAVQEAECAFLLRYHSDARRFLSTTGTAVGLPEGTLRPEDSDDGASGAVGVPRPVTPPKDYRPNSGASAYIIDAEVVQRPAPPEYHTDAAG